jgi:hypothetical protein
MGTPLWVLGVVLIIIGSIGNNLGNNLVSLGHKRKKEHDEEKAKQEKAGENDVEANKSPAQAESAKSQGGKDADSAEEKKHARLRVIGTIIFVVGNLATFAAFGFAAQSLLASLESIQFVSNVFFIKYVHKEVITWRMIIATTSIVAGNTLVVLFSEHAAYLFTSRDILYLYQTNSAYHAYLCIAGVLWGINHYTYRTYHIARTKENRSLWKHSFIEPFTFTVSSAIIGTQAVLNSKCMSMLIQVSARGVLNEFERPTVWVILVTWLLLVSYWVRRLDLGLALFPPLFIIPVMQVFFVFFAILCGGIYFEEFVHFTWQQYVGFIVGVLMILAGVYGLAPTDVAVIPQEVEHQVERRLSVQGAIIENEVKHVVRQMSLLALGHDGDTRGNAAKVAAAVVRDQHEGEKASPDHSGLDSRASLDIKAKPMVDIAQAALPKHSGVVAAAAGEQEQEHNSEERKSYHQLNSTGGSQDGGDGGDGASPAKTNRKVVKRYPSTGSDPVAPLLAGTVTTSTSNGNGAGAGADLSRS